MGNSVTRTSLFPTMLLAGLAAFGTTELVCAAPFLFSANPGNITVTRIDLATGDTKVVMDANDGLTSPTELTVDEFGNLYVANSGSLDVLRLSIDDRVVLFASGEGVLTNIHGLAFSPQGDLFIADEPNRIYRFDATSRSFELFGDVTSADAAFNVLEDIEFDRNGNLYAASGQNVQGLGAIVKFDPEGNASVLASGLDNPRDLAVDELARLYVANRVGEIVNRIDLATGVIELFADISNAPGNPRGVDTDLANNVYVLNSNGEIRRWNANGEGGEVEFRSEGLFSEALAFLATRGPDKDGDGVPNNEDQCRDSDLSPAVTIQSCNTGVPNTVFPSGCTMTDLIASCKNHGDSSVQHDAGTHGEFVSCVSQLVNRLKRAEIITGRQRGAIQSCAAQADLR